MPEQTSLNGSPTLLALSLSLPHSLSLAFSHSHNSSEYCNLKRIHVRILFEFRAKRPHHTKSMHLKWTLAFIGVSSSNLAQRPKLLLCWRFLIELFFFVIFHWYSTLKTSFALTNCDVSTLHVTIQKHLANSGWFEPPKALKLDYFLIQFLHTTPYFNTKNHENDHVDFIVSLNIVRPWGQFY